MLMPLVTAENLYRQTEQQADRADRATSNKFVQLPTGNDSVNTAQLLLGVCQILHAAPIIAHGEAVQVSS